MYFLALVMFGFGSLSVQTAELDTKDKEDIFGMQKYTQIAMLSEEEVKETQVEGFLLSFGIAALIGLRSLAYNCFTGNCEFETGGLWKW